jgi:hypothetical protein
MNRSTFTHFVSHVGFHHPITFLFASHFGINLLFK